MKNSARLAGSCLLGKWRSGESQLKAKLGKRKQASITKTWVWWLTCHPRYVGGISMRIIVQTCLGKNGKILFKKQLKLKGLVVAQVFECLPSK
jgi:hypothetical protein